MVRARVRACGGALCLPRARVRARVGPTRHKTPKQPRNEDVEVEEDCIEWPVTVGSKSQKATRVPIAVEDVQVYDPAVDSNNILPDFYRALQKDRVCNPMAGCKRDGDLCEAEDNNKCKGNPNSNTEVFAECCSCEAKVCRSVWYCGDTCPSDTSPAPTNAVTPAPTRPFPG